MSVAFGTGAALNRLLPDNQDRGARPQAQINRIRVPGTRQIVRIEPNDLATVCVHG